MLVLVLAVSSGLAGLLLIDPLKHVFNRRRRSRWHGYYKN